MEIREVDEKNESTGERLSDLDNQMNHLTLDPEAEIYVPTISDTLKKKDIESISSGFKLQETRCLPLKSEIAETPRMDAKNKYAQNTVDSWIDALDEHATTSVGTQERIRP